MTSAEDAEGSAVIARQRALEAEIGKEAARANYLASTLVNRLQSPVRIWREHRQLTLRWLSEEAGVPQGYLSEIETGKKPGSLDAMARIALIHKERKSDFACRFPTFRAASPREGRCRRPSTWQPRRWSCISRGWPRRG